MKDNLNDIGINFSSLTWDEKKEINEWLFDKSSEISSSYELSALLLRERNIYRSPKAVYEHLRGRGRIVTRGMTSSKGNNDAPESKKIDNIVVQPLSFDTFAEYASKHLHEIGPLREVPDKIKATKLEDMGFDTEQVAVALFSDYHFGSRIDRRASNGLAEYNPDIARERLARWRDGVLRFTQLWQIVNEVNTLHLFALGDDIEGHGNLFGSQKFQISDSVNFQILEFAKDMTEVIIEFLSRYEKIKIYKVPGNHGRITNSHKEAYIVDNFETLAWELIGRNAQNIVGGSWSTTENGIRQLVGGPVELYIHSGTFAFVDICGWLCVARHGNGVADITRTYTGAASNKLRMNAIVGEVINYYFYAHHHYAAGMENEIRGEIIQNSCFVGPSLLSIEMSRAAANLPSQELMLFHPVHGKTHHSRLYLASPDEIRQFAVINRELE